MDFSLYNPDGTYNDGTPQPRPSTTPAEQAMSPFMRNMLPASPQEDGPGWFSRQWDRIAFQSAKPGDNVFQTMWGEVSEAGSSLMSGLRRSRYNYALAAQNSAEFVADKAGLQFDAKKDFMAAALHKWKNMQIEPTTEEWEDQLAYLIGQLAPDVAMLFVGGGVVGGAVSLGSKAAGFGKSAAGIANIVARVTGDVAINTTQVLAHEAAQAEIEGRETEYGRAGKEAVVMAALMSTTGRAAKAFGLSRKSTAVLTGTTLGGATSLYYDDDDPAKGDAIAANAVLGGLFGLAVPQTNRVGARDLQTWVRLRKQAANPPQSMVEWQKEFFREFLPNSYEKVWDHEPKREEKLYKGHWNDAEHMSPKDEFLLFLSQASKKNVFGYNDKNIVQLLAEFGEQSALGEYKLLTDPANPNTPGGGRQQSFELRTGVDKKTLLQEAKVLVDSINETDAVWMKDHPSYKPRVEQAHTPPQYKDRPNLKRTKDGSKQREEGVIALDKDKNNQPLMAHELSWREYSSVEGSTPQHREYHLGEIRKAANEYNPKERGKKKKSWPNKGGIIQHELWDDFGHIHSRPKGGFQKQGAAETGRNLANRTKQTILENSQQSHDAVKKVLNENNPSWTDTLYRWLVDPGGRILNTLEEAGMVSVRNAAQLTSLKKGKVEQKMREIDDKVDFWNMSPEEDSIIASYLFLNAETDNVKRLGHDPDVKRGIEQRPENIGPALAALREDAKRMPGGWEAMQKKITAIEDLFGEMFENLHEHGIVGDKTFDILREYKYVPQKTIHEAMRKYQDHVLEARKKEGSLDVTDSALHDLQADATLKGKHTNLESLVTEHISKVYSLIAKNELFTEMSKIPDSPYWTLDKPKGRVGGEPDINFNKHSFMVDGEPTPIWVEKKVSTLLQAKDDSFLKADLKTALRFISGVHPIQLTAVAINPIFAIATHPLDLWSIATHHQALPKSTPKVIKDMYVHNEVTGAVPMLKNFMHAWNRDDVYKKYLENDGVTTTIVSSISAAEMFKRSTDMLDKQKGTEKFKRGWNKGIEMLGKFGHTMEVAMRMTEVDMLVKTGKYTAKEAGHESLRRLNYGRRGEFMHLLDSLVPFANAQAQILASQMNEIKTPKGRARALATMGQLTAGLALTRILVEENFPGFTKDIPWETRMRYWIFPTGAKEIDHKTGQEKQVFLKIKKAYNPFFMMANAGAELALDAYYYGKEGLPPMSTFSLFWDALKVASPVELQNNIPPAGKVLLAWTGDKGVDVSGRDVYKGPMVESREEVNTELHGGKKTHQSAIAMGDLTGLSPVRWEKSYDSYVARNPLSWIAGSFVETPTEASQSTISEAVKLPGIRSFTGTTDKRWAEYEAGILARKQAGSTMYHEYHAKVLAPLSKLYNRDIGPKEFISQIKALSKDAKPNIKIKMIDMAQKEIKAKAFMDKLLKQFPADLVYDNMQNFAFWAILRLIDEPVERADRYYDRLYEIDDPYWSRQFKKMAATRGLFSDRFFAAEVRKLEKKGK